MDSTMVSTLLTVELLKNWPLPQPDEEGDKEDRGRVLIVGGSHQVPGGVILAATAALRAGAGKVQIATGKSIAPLIAGTIPEARVFALPETEDGTPAPEGLPKIEGFIRQTRAVLVGPGLVDEDAVAMLTEALLPKIETAMVILDAAPLSYLAHHRECCHRFNGNTILTPHAGEMAGLLGIDKAEVRRDRQKIVRRAAAELQAVVALKGAETLIASPEGEMYRNRTGNVGLATSGSGDTLAGIVAGLAARGASPLQAAAWGVYLHGSAGDRLKEKIGPLGFLARELLAEIPPLMAELSSPDE
ncbi:MAG: NAD(P)H-hydrate dehydratase [Armatimonadetes bacterium]|nr:NAD(P)H-hydrate dehydratase [Armatimonadota bacterium]